jgi:acyl-CoA reductase-like NAD-dependent aldehyde dehydrogenase
MNFQQMFERQKRYFATGTTRSLGWRVEQLDRMARLVGENESALQRAVAKDFKTASQEQIFETLSCLGEVAYQKSRLRDWMAPTEAPVPRALAATGHRGIVYRDPYGVALIVGPFNGPLLLLLRPAITALAAGNCCVLKLSEKLNSSRHQASRQRLQTCRTSRARRRFRRCPNSGRIRIPLPAVSARGNQPTNRPVRRSAGEPRSHSLRSVRGGA